MKSRQYVDEHRRILKAMEKLTKKGDICISVNELARELRKDSRTVRAHLEIAREYKVGSFADKNKTIFCTKKGLRNVLRELE